MRQGDHLDGLQSSELRNFQAHIVNGNPSTPVKAQFWYNDATDTYVVQSESIMLILGRLNQIAAPDAAVDFNNQQAVGLAPGSGTGHAVTWEQFQDAINGLDYKTAARIGFTTNVAPSALTNGSVHQSVTLATGDRVALLQSGQAASGIYRVTGAGAAVRTDDADTAADLRAATFFIEEGTLQGSLWTLSTDPPITLGTTALTFTQIGAAGTYTVGTNGGLQLVGNAFSILLRDGSLTLDASGLGLTIPVTVARGGTGATDAATARTNLGANGKASGNIGNGSLSTIPFTHNLNTTDITSVTVRDIATGEAEGVGWEPNGVNAIDLYFSYVPANASKRVTVAG